MQITILGTSAMMPTKERNPSAIFLKYKTEGILFDCGEGTQRQMKITGISIPSITRICISHWHGDHVFGLPGLLQTYAAAETGKTLHIYGPKGTKKHFKTLFEGMIFEEKTNIKVHEITKPGKFFENKDFTLEAMPLKHPVPCIGFSFIEKDRRKIKIEKIKKIGIPEGPLLGELQKGKTITFKGKKIKPEETTTIIKGRKITIITDTELNKNCYKLAKNADILISEGTFTSKLKEKAKKYGHLTALEAAQLASKANVKKLILTHFSARYKDITEIEEDARTAFDNVITAYDFMKITL
ncbi:ribonuclease Z [Candidatus Woesearchaeota archaeon]|nr:MAG: ribonuclease Z [Candidatus Woesearchaeota archaeon]